MLQNSGVLAPHYPMPGTSRVCMDLCPRRPALTAAAGSALRFCRPRYIPAAPACSPRRSDPTARGGDPDLILVGQAEPALPKVLPHAAKRLGAAPAAARCPALTAAVGSAPRFCRPRYTPAAPACSPRRSGRTARGAAGTPISFWSARQSPPSPRFCRTRQNAWAPHLRRLAALRSQQP